METLQTVCIALIQGITEFLPISSSAHVQFPSLLLGWQDQGLHFDVATHAGSLVAVLAFYRQKLMSLAIGTYRSLRVRSFNEETDLVLKLVVATLPVVVVGFLFRDFIATETRNLPTIVTTTILFGVLLGLADWRTGHLKKQGHTFVETNPTYLAAVAIGFAQVLALIPGTSRSGITITAALLLGLGRTQAATFSFLLAIPVIIAAFSLTLFDLQQSTIEIDYVKFGLGFGIAAISAYLCIGAFLSVIEKVGMWPFVVYRLIVGVLLGMLVWL